jgi:hypothetical protein
MEDFAEALVKSTAAIHRLMLELDLWGSDSLIWDEGY